MFLNVTDSSERSTGSQAARSGPEVDLDVLPSQIGGAHDVHGELGLVTTEDVQDSVLLDIEVSLHSSHWSSSSGSRDLLEQSVELEEVAQLDEVPRVGHGIAGGCNALMRIAGKRIGSRVVDHWALDHGVTISGVSVHPVGPIVRIELGGSHGCREEAEEDQPTK